MSSIKIVGSHSVTTVVGPVGFSVGLAFDLRRDTLRHALESLAREAAGRHGGTVRVTVRVGARQGRAAIYPAQEPSLAEFVQIAPDGLAGHVEVSRQVRNAQGRGSACRTTGWGNRACPRTSPSRSSRRGWCCPRS